LSITEAKRIRLNSQRTYSFTDVAVSRLAQLIAEFHREARTFLSLYSV